MQLVDYLKDVKAELTHVKWPSQKTTLRFSAVVVVMSLISAAYLGAFDFGFAELIKSLVSA